LAATPIPVFSGITTAVCPPKTEVEALIVSNCRYAVCGGVNCEPWEFAVDDAFVREYIAASDAESAKQHVMTTSHDTESVDDVAFFFVRSTNFDEHDFRKFLVLHIGGSPNQQKAVVDAVRRKALGEAAV
jgi:hypothetical protein